MATTRNISPNSRAVSGAQSVPNSVGDLWELTLNGEMPGNVATASTWHYRQLSSFTDEQDPAKDLVDAFLVGAGSAWELLRLLLSDKFMLECATARNLSAPQSFTSTFAIDDGTGGIPESEIHSAQTVLKIRIQDDEGLKKARKVIYLPGLAQSSVADSKLAQAQQPVLTAAINAMYSLEGVNGNWSWQYTKDPEDPDRPADNAHGACYIGRLKGRTPSLC